MVGPLGFEPRIGRLKVCCDNRFTTIPCMVPPPRFELGRHGLRVRHAALTS